MDVVKAINIRRSIRKYKDKEVSDDLIKELLDAARLAPSGHNSQPWVFKIIKEKVEIEKLREQKMFDQDFVYTAPVIIVCCANPESYPKAKVKNDMDDSDAFRASRDLAIATQNLVLRATELGLGTCYIGWVDKVKIKKVLRIPKSYIVPYVITVGYGDEEPKLKPRKDIPEIILK